MIMAAPTQDCPICFGHKTQRKFITSYPIAPADKDTPAIRGILQCQRCGMFFAVDIPIEQERTQ